MKHLTQHIINFAAAANIGERCLVGVALVCAKLGVVLMPCLSRTADCLRSLRGRSLRHLWQVMFNQVIDINGIGGDQAGQVADSVVAPSANKHAGIYFVAYVVNTLNKQTIQ